MARDVVPPCNDKPSAVDQVLIESFLRSRRARNLSASTVTSYDNDLKYFGSWLAGQGLELAKVRRQEVETWITECLARGLAAATVARRFRTLQQFYKWAAEEEEVVVDPLAKMPPPKVPVQPVPVIPPDHLQRLLNACKPAKGEGGDVRATFENRRDSALIQMLSTTGVRASELMNLAVSDVDLASGTFTVMGKGRRARVVALMPKVAEALDRYLRQRRRHPSADTPWLWLGARGRLTDSGLRQLLERRCNDAGLEPINPHRFRHTFAHEAKSKGMQDGELMSIAGWQSPQMLHRYGASAAAERAQEAHRRLFGDR